MNSALLEGAEKVIQLHSASSRSDSEGISDEEGDEASIVPSSPTMSRNALHGLIGEWAHLVEPHTEASLPALYISALVAVGALVGRSPNVVLDGARHGVNLFALLVGPTATGRKGTACARARALVRSLDSQFAAEKISSGLHSGQGVIYHLRDPRPPQGRAKKGDPGVTDKRLLVIEAEFAGALRQMGRDGNTLSAILREGWDGYTLRTLTKGDPLIASDPHLAVIGQITPDELGRVLNPTETANGFANRFLFVWCERARVLPFDSYPDPIVERALIAELGTAILRAAKIERVGLTNSGALWWNDRYADLSSGNPGPAGAATQRAAPQVRRLAMLLAVLDGKADADVPHLDAALATWEYARGSASYVLPAHVLSLRAARIEKALLEAGPAGLSRTVIRREVLGSNNVPVSVIAGALIELHHSGIALRRRDSQSGRRAELWIHRKFSNALLPHGTNGTNGT